jgi:hypothetical protein
VEIDAKGPWTSIIKHFSVVVMGVVEFEKWPKMRNAYVGPRR